jgi:hypothetical protein
MPVAGEVVTLSITASDPDGDPLTILWQQTSPLMPGTFGNTNQASTTWYSFVLDVDSLNFTFQVTVSDGHNPAATRQVTLAVTTPSYANDVQSIWTARCVTCHDGTQPSVPLNLSAGVSHGALVNQPMVHSCSNTQRVVPGDPSASGLINKLLGTSCGTRMPENASPLTDAEMVMIQSWIKRGALAN